LQGGSNKESKLLPTWSHPVLSPHWSPRTSSSQANPPPTWRSLSRWNTWKGRRSRR
jgi:hypothetical protein